MIHILNLMTSPKMASMGFGIRIHSPQSWQVASRAGCFLLVMSYHCPTMLEETKKMVKIFHALNFSSYFSSFFNLKLVFPKYSVRCHLGGLPSPGVVNHWRKHSSVFIWLSGAWAKTTSQLKRGFSTHLWS